MGGKVQRQKAKITADYNNLMISYLPFLFFVKNSYGNELGKLSTSGLDVPPNGWDGAGGNNTHTPGKTPHNHPNVFKKSSNRGELS